MRKLLILCLFSLFLAACTYREVHTDISNNNTLELKADGCTVDQDCVLHNANYAWQCCWQGRCDAIDYSKDNWIAVNGQWLRQEQAKWCPKDCGPAPMCPTTLVNTSFFPRCISGVCIKSGE